MQIYQTTGYSKWTDVDDVIRIQKYCMDDAVITMKITKNRRLYSDIMPDRHIFNVTGPHVVDGAPWYQIDLDYNAAQWLRELCDNRVNEVKGIDRCFDVPEDIYILSKLKWA